LYDSNQKTIYIGQKIEDISEKYFNNKIKELLEFMRIIEIENSKRKKSYHQAKQLLRKRGYPRGNCASRGNTKERKLLKNPKPV
jgi:hypothetical protein